MKHYQIKICGPEDKITESTSELETKLKKEDTLSFKIDTKIDTSHPHKPSGLRFEIHRWRFLNGKIDNDIIYNGWEEDPIPRVVSLIKKDNKGLY